MDKWGWWAITFDLTLEGESVRFCDLSPDTQAHICEAIEQGYTQGEICEYNDEED